MRSRFFVAVVGLAVALAAPAFAQGIPTAKKEAEVSADADALKQFQVPAELLAQLDKPAQEIASAIANINTLLDGNIDKIKNAEKEFDRVVDAIEASAKASSPDGEFVKRVDELTRLAREEGIKARNLGLPDAEKQFNAYAGDFETAKTKALDHYNSTFRIIRQIRQEKERFLTGIKLNNLALARNNINEGLRLFAQLDGQLKGLRETLPKPTGVSQ